jgi:hypothetical protein
MLSLLLVVDAVLFVMNVQAPFGLALVPKATFDEWVLCAESRSFGIGWVALATRFGVKSATPSQICHAGFRRFLDFRVPSVVPVNAVFALTSRSVKAEFFNRFVFPRL